MTRRICVFCGSKAGDRPAYREAAQLAGRAIARAGCELVYGGAAHGLMGAVADAVLEGGGRVIGVFPAGVVSEESAHPRLTERHVVATMHERKAVMHERSTAFLALPGGLGTMDELFETLTWAQLRHHSKPVGILDVEGYYRPLLVWIEQATRSGFAPEGSTLGLHVGTDPQELVDRLLADARAVG